MNSIFFPCPFSLFSTVTTSPHVHASQPPLSRTNQCGTLPGCTFLFLLPLPLACLLHCVVLSQPSHMATDVHPLLCLPFIVISYTDPVPVQGFLQYSCVHCPHCCLCPSESIHALGILNVCFLPIAHEPSKANDNPPLAPSVYVSIISLVYLLSQNWHMLHCSIRPAAINYLAITLNSSECSISAPLALSCPCLSLVLDD